MFRKHHRSGPDIQWRYTRRIRQRKRRGRFTNRLMSLRSNFLLNGCLASAIVRNLAPFCHIKSSKALTIESRPINHLMQQNGAKVSATKQVSQTKPAHEEVRKFGGTGSVISRLVERPRSARSTGLYPQDLRFWSLVLAKLRCNISANFFWTPHHLGGWCS